MTIIFYQNKSQSNKVDKEITQIVSYECVIKNSTSVVNPVITIERDALIESNYAYIPHLRRYYYITSIKSIRANVWEISLRCDVLMSFRDDIRASLAIVNRQSNMYDMYLNDGTFKAFQNPEIQTISFPAGFTGDKGYVLLMNGASNSSDALENGHEGGGGGHSF